MIIKNKQNLIECEPEEMALKSFFLGPQAENTKFIRNEINSILDSWLQWRAESFPEDGAAITGSEQNHIEFQKKITNTQREVKALLNQFSKELPKFSPRYMGHMFSENSMPAMLGHIIALLHNPNNVSRESSWVGVDIELQAIEALCKMVGYPDESIGHFTSGGTIANFEAFIRAKNKWIQNLLSNKNNNKNFNEACYSSGGHQLQESLGDIEIYQHITKKYNFDFTGPVIIVPNSKHYSWTKAASIFGLGENNIVSVELNKYGQISIDDLNIKINDCLLKKRPILAIVSVFGTTELGTLDPIEEVNYSLQAIQKKHDYNIWHHTDAAYGGFFCCLKDSDFFEHKKQLSLQALKSTTSITIDPHKLGYVPYASGAFLCRKSTDYFNHEISAPYVDFQLHKDLGPYTLEGSRPATGSVAMYMTAKCIGLNEKGYGQILKRTIKVKELFQTHSKEQQIPICFVETQGTNINGFSLKLKARTLSEMNKETILLQKLILSSDGEQKEYYFSKTKLGLNYKSLIENFCKENNLEMDCCELNLMRLTYMNPFIVSKNSNVNYIDDCLRYLKESIQML